MVLDGESYNGKGLAMERRRTLVEQPFFSICIPQYNRTSFLIEACKSLVNQTFKDFEVCISDDCSTDGRQRELLDFLEESDLSFVYRRQEQNRKYDGNLRASIALARGKYCFLLGNDDRLASPTTLEDLYGEIQRFGDPGVVITNYEDFATGKKFKRIKQTRIIGKGPYVASSNFRNFSFVSGVLLDSVKAKELATDKWDGSEMYQMFIGCRIIAEDSPLLGIERVTVQKDIQVPGEHVDSYTLWRRVDPCPVVERQLPMGLIGKLVIDAIQTYLSPSERRPTIERVLLQVFLFTYPFWIFEYRKVQSWKYALGVSLGMRPRNTLSGLDLGLSQRLRLTALYGIVSFLGLVTPLRVFYSLYPRLYRFAKASGS